MKLHVKYELGDEDDVADDAKETGIMVGVVTSNTPFGAKAEAVIVRRSGKVALCDIKEVEVIDREIMDKLDAIVERAAELGLEAPDTD